MGICEDGCSRAVRKVTLQQTNKPNGSGEAVSKLSIVRAFSPRVCCCRIPGASPQADTGRAQGAFKSIFHNNLSAEGAILCQPGAQPQEEWAMENKGLKARSITSFETASGDPSAQFSCVTGCGARRVDGCFNDKNCERFQCQAMDSLRIFRQRVVRDIPNSAAAACRFP
jgi:hypothetical protein